MATFTNELSNQRDKMISSMIQLVLKKDLSWDILASMLDEMSSSVTNSKQIIAILLKEMKSLQSKVEGFQNREISNDQHNVSLDYDVNETELDKEIEKDERNDAVQIDIFENPKPIQDQFQYDEIEENTISENEELETYDDTMEKPEETIHGTEKSLMVVNDEFQENVQVNELTDKNKELWKEFENKFYVFVGEENINKDTEDIQKIDQEIQNTNKKFECSICFKSFKGPNRLQIHERVHSGERPYRCNYCQKEFKEKSNLKQHESIHKGEKYHVCKFCQKTFGHISTLIKHERIHTGEKPFKCKICSKSFTSSTSLKLHQIVHTKDKSHVCKFCQNLLAISVL